jgi:hypothetical protein
MGMEKSGMKQPMIGDDLQAKTEEKKKKKEKKKTNNKTEEMEAERRSTANGGGRHGSEVEHGQTRKKKKNKKGKGNDNDKWTRAVGGEGRWGGNEGMAIILHGGNKGGKIEKMEGEGWIDWLIVSLMLATLMVMACVQSLNT